MKIRFILFLVFFSVSSWLHSTTWHIKLDGTGDFTSIQQGINASTNGDTVLVSPGTYYENIIYNGKNITVASLEITTNDPSYIPLTIIDGQQLESCVQVRDQETNAEIQGFTITNGWGSQSWNKSGGGIFVMGEYQSPTFFSVTNCCITENYAENGGGIYSYRSIVGLSGVSIHTNYGYVNGGGIHVNDTLLNFDADNRCNIYDNLAATGVELYSFRCQTNHVIVDTFTVLEPTRYFANQYELISCPNPPFSFDILHYTLEPVNHDLYVSPDGDDSDSGLSPNDPLKTIMLAIRNIASDSLNPKTVHLAAGTYSKSLNDQFFAFGGKDYVKIIGDSKTTTIIDGENDNYCLFYMGCSDNSVLKNLTFQNITSEYPIMYIHDSNNTLIENILLQNFVGINGSSAFSSSPVECMYLNNIDIMNCTNDMFVTAAHLCEINHLEIIDCTISDNLCSGPPPHPQMCAGIQASTYADGDIIIENSKFENNIVNTNEFPNGAALVLTTLNGESSDFTITDCLFANNECTGTPSKIVTLDGSSNIYINNNTFVDNQANYTLQILREPVEFHNNIMYNNCNYEIFLPDHSPWGDTSVLNISHCNIQGGQDAILNQNNANIVNWEEGNIDEDPQFLLFGDDPYQLTEFSPCIDVGTPDTTGLLLPPWDLLYNQRVWDGDGNGDAVIDMGCYEYGSSYASGFISGYIIDTMGNLLENAEISAGSFTTHSNEDGEYNLEAIVGSYNVVCYQDGYEVSIIEDVTVNFGETTTVNFILTPAVDIDDILNAEVIQLSNYPNPFNPTTTICFSVTQSPSIVELSVYNIKGQKVKTLPINSSTDQPINSIVWNGTDQNNKPLSSGIYFARLKNGNKQFTHKMLLMK